MPVVVADTNIAAPILENGMTEDEQRYVVDTIREVFDV